MLQVHEPREAACRAASADSGWGVLPGPASQHHMVAHGRRKRGRCALLRVSCCFSCVRQINKLWLRTKSVLASPPFMFIPSKELETPKEREADCSSLVCGSGWARAEPWGSRPSLAAKVIRRVTGLRTPPGHSGSFLEARSRDEVREFGANPYQRKEANSARLVPNGGSANGNTVNQFSW